MKHNSCTYCSSCFTDYLKYFLQEYYILEYYINSFFYLIVKYLHPYTGLNLYIYARYNLLCNLVFYIFSFLTKYVSLLELFLILYCRYHLLLTLKPTFLLQVSWLLWFTTLYFELLHSKYFDVTRLNFKYLSIYLFNLRYKKDTLFLSFL